MGKFTIKSPLKHVNTAGSTDHTHNGNPHPPDFNTKPDLKDAVEISNYQNVQGGSIPGMFAIPMGIYHRYKDYQRNQQHQNDIAPDLDTEYIESMKYENELIEREKKSPGTIRFETLKLGQ